MSRHSDTRFATLAVLTLALAVRFVNVWYVAGLPVAVYQFTWAESDMGTNVTWSGHIMAGDLLGRDRVQPYMWWMRDIASLDTWERWWGGPAVFYQAPLYAYVLAGIRAVVGDEFWRIALAQALLGWLNVALVLLIARRFFPPPIPTIAGLGAALYGPFLLHETLLLRDILGVTVSLLLLWGLARCDDARPGRWFVAGLLLALAVLARELILLFVPFIAIWILQRKGRRAGS